MAEASVFPPPQVRAIVNEVATLLKERKETVSVAETVRPLRYVFWLCVFSITLDA
jgi:hypothetical protein